MGFTKRKVALVLVAVLLLTGYGTRGQAGRGPVLLHVWDFSMEQVDFHKQIAEEYHRLHPNITIEWRSIVQAQYNQALPLAFQSKQPPDIFYWTENGPNALKQLLAQGWLHPLSPEGQVPDAFLKRWPKGSFLDGIHAKGDLEQAKGAVRECLRLLAQMGDTRKADQVRAEFASLA